MRHGYRAAIVCSAVSLFAIFAFGQDSQSLGDAGRQARQQRAKSTQTQTKDATAAKTPKVITNEDMPAHFQPVAETTSAHAEAAKKPEGSQDDQKASGEQWKSQIAGQRDTVSSLESQIAQLSESVHFAGANCVSNCAQWNERQLQKVEQIDRMKSQLEEAKKRLEDMQDQARQQGYGSSVYDPD